MDKFVAFRADGSIETGIGHIKRCLTLAKKFKEQGYQVLFLCRSITEDLKKELSDSGMDLLELPVSMERDEHYHHSSWLQGTEASDAVASLRLLNSHSRANGVNPELIFVDHYSLASPWEKELSVVAPVFVIDDLCDRPHCCCWLMDQTVGRVEKDYLHLVNKECTLLLGPQYALLRDEFQQYRESALIRRKNISAISNILVTLGGIDKNNISALVIKALEHSCYQKKITLIIGSSNPNINSLQETIDSSVSDIDVIINSANMAEEMLKADLCIGAAGTTSWERCTLGLPTINLTIAKNQENIATNLDKVGAAIDFGWLVTDEDIRHLTLLINSLSNDPGQCIKMAQRSVLVCDGLGVHRIFSIVNNNNA